MAIPYPLAACATLTTSWLVRSPLWLSNSHLSRSTCIQSKNALLHNTIAIATIVKMVCLLNVSGFTPDISLSKVPFDSCTPTSPRGTFLARCMNLPLLPKLSNWPISRHCPHARGDQKLLEGRRREDPSRNRSALCPFQWSTWQQNIRPRTCWPYTIDILGNWSFPSMHKSRSKRRIAH
jgi:hypothetical protein